MGKREIDVGELLWSAVERAVIRETALIGHEVSPNDFIKRAIDRELEQKQIEVPPEQTPDWADVFKVEMHPSDAAIQDDVAGSWVGAHRSVSSGSRRAPATIRLMDTSAWVRQAVEKELEKAGIKVGGAARRQDD